MIFENRLIDMDQQIQEFLRHGTHQQDFLKLLKQREHFITEHFLKCAAFRHHSSV